MKVKKKRKAERKNNWEISERKKKEKWKEKKDSNKEMKKINK